MDIVRRNYVSITIGSGRVDAEKELQFLERSWNCKGQINLAVLWKVLFYLVKRKTIFVILIKLEALANLPKR